MKNLEFATDRELNKMLELATGRAFRLCAKGDEAGAMQAKRDALRVKDEINDRDEVCVLRAGKVISTESFVQGRQRASDKEIGLGFL